jgi:TPR repeat protein
MFNLGLLHEKGLGVPKDETKARELLEKAVELGHPKAMN